MADVTLVVKATPGHACRAILAVTSALLLIPYMVIKHGPSRLDLNLVRHVDKNRSLQFSTRYLQTLTEFKTRTSPAVSLPVPQSILLTVPPSVISALNYNTTQSGYLTGNISQLKFTEYSYDVDLRIIVLTYNRGNSLLKCLNSLNAVDFRNSTVSLHVWIDRINSTNAVDLTTLKVAHNFYFLHGEYHVHVQHTHIGILGQWVNTWRPSEKSREVALILEDDMTVSHHFWRWLKPVHASYWNHSDISGYGLSHPGMEHMHATYLDIPSRFSIYMYKVICTWGFSPHPNSWRHFQEWFYHKEVNSSFLPIVPNILPSQWFLSELRYGRERSLWEMWHICYSHYSKPTQYTVMLNTAQEGLLAVNRHEAGLHDQGTARTDPLCEVWKDAYSIFPKVLPCFGYDGKLENADKVEEEDDRENAEGGAGYQIDDIYWAKT